MICTPNGILRTFVIDPDSTSAPGAHDAGVLKHVWQATHWLEWQHRTDIFMVILITPIQGPEINHRIIDCREADVEGLLKWLKPLERHIGTCK